MKAKAISNKYQMLFLNLLFIGFVSLLFLIRLLIYLKYNLNYIDSDQPYMWVGALDYSKGLFYEPRFYAQDYNTFMEGLFAVPLLWLNVPVYFAVPLATHFIALFPYMFTAIYLYLKNHKVSALLVLALLLCMPIENDLLNALPRGFVTGLFFCSFFILNILNPKQLTYFTFNACLAVIGFFVNPNSVLVSVPFVFFMFLNHYQNKSFYKASIFPLLLIYPTYLFFNQFYILHPDYILHPLEYQFSFKDYFWDNLQNLDQRFCHISLFTVKNCLILLSVILITFIFAFKQNKKLFYSLLFFTCFLLFSFCFGKTTEGSTWVYGSYSRMYLGIPFLLALSFSLLKLNTNKYWLLLLIVPLVYGFQKMKGMDEQLKSQLKNQGGVSLFTFNDFRVNVEFYKEVCIKSNHHFLLVSSNHWANTLLSFAGQCLDKNFPECSETFGEKRYWVREKNKRRFSNDFYFLACDYRFDELVPKNINFEIKKIDTFGLFCIKNFKGSVADFIVFANKYDKIN